MPRSERCGIRGNCLDGIAMLSLAQAPVAGGAAGGRGALGAGRTALASGGSSGRSEPSGLEPFRRPLGGFRRAVESRQRGSKNRGEAWAGGRRSSDKAELEDDRVRAGKRPSSGPGGQRAGLAPGPVRPAMKRPGAAIGSFNGFWRIPALRRIATQCQQCRPCATAANVATGHQRT
jgi:hypothetical protein